MKLPEQQTKIDKVTDLSPKYSNSGSPPFPIKKDPELVEQSKSSYETLIRIDKVTERTGLSRSYIYELSGLGKFPQSISLIPGGTSKAWISSEVDKWIQDRINASRVQH